MEMLPQRLWVCNCRSEQTIDTDLFEIVDELTRKGLLNETDQLRPSGTGGMLLTCGTASPLARHLRNGSELADELAETLGRDGYCISVTHVVVHVERGT